MSSGHNQPTTSRGRSRGRSQASRPSPQSGQPSSQVPRFNPAQAGGSQSGAPSGGKSGARSEEKGAAPSWGRGAASQSSQPPSAWSKPDDPKQGRGAASQSAQPAPALPPMAVSDLRPPSIRGSLSVNQPTDRVPFTRPLTVTSKLGSHGRTVDLQTNYVEVVRKPEWCLAAYRVDFVPEEDSIMVRKALFRTHKDQFGAFLFDGTTLFCTKLFREPFELHGQKKNGEPYTIKIKLTHTVENTNPQFMQIFNIILKRGLALLDLQLVGRDYYDLEEKVDVPNFNFEVWPGVSTSIRQHEHSVLLNIDISHKIMRRDTAYDVIASCQRRGFDEKAVRDVLIGNTVITRYNNATYRIDDVDFRSTPCSTFKKKNDDITFIQYYHDRYNIKIRNLNQPLLLSKPKARDIRGGRHNPILLIPELCNMTGLTDDMSKNFQLMKSLAEHTRLRPADRMEKSRALLSRVNKCMGAQQELANWGLKLAPDLLRFQGRVLDNETIILADKRTMKTDEDASWTRGIRNKTAMFRFTPLNNWAVIYPKKFAADVTMFIKTLIQASSGINYAVSDPRVIEEINDDRVSSYVAALNKIVPKNPHLVMVILPNNKADRYSAVKINCCIERPIPSQVLLMKNLTARGAMSIATKLAIQMNCKLGGAPWNVNIPFNIPVMIVGFDVCHDTKYKEKSFGAMVATVSSDYTSYYSNVVAHKNGEELSNFFGMQICQAMSVFKKNNGVYPAKIFVYRDGVGDGNIPYVLSHEVENIKKNLRGMLQAEPVMAFIVVSKRISTRFFRDKKNPPPGTIVDDFVTCPEKYDFFIVSQAVTQGTVTPTSYNVIYDNTQLTPDVMQRLTYKLCHMYYNWTGTVRVPAPCQYAHKLAFLTGQHLHAQSSNSLDELLYYL